MKRADVVVVGLGAHGSATAYQLAKNGAQVIGLDQYRPPHTMGSSHGDSRITREATAEGAAYARLAMRSHALWREIEAGLGVDILTQCGYLLIGSQASGGTERLTNARRLAAELNIRHERLNADELRHRYPQLQLPHGTEAYFEPGGGFVRPEAAVSAQLALAQRHGARLIFGEEVIDVRSERSSARVTTRSGQYLAGKVVLAVGAWISRFTAGRAQLFPVYRQALHWFPIAPDQARAFSPAHFPVFMWTFGADPWSDYFYGFPALDGADGGLKVATAQFARATTPRTVDRNVAVSESRSMYEHCVRDRIPALGASSIRSAACLYTVTPDHHFVIDAHPEQSGIFVISACSGHGFKHSAAIGEAVAQVVTTGRSQIDLSFFRWQRLD